MHVTRRALVLLLLMAVAVLGWVLYANVQQAHLFSLNVQPQAAHPQTSEPRNEKERLAQQVQARVSGTTLVSLTTVSATTLLESPRYSGQDDKGRQWQLQADSASQQGSAASSTYVLANVSGTWQSPSQTAPLTVQANQGQYNPQSNHIQLNGDVVVVGQGLTLTAPQASASMVTRQVDATGGVSVTGVVGGWHMHVTAPRLTATQGNQHLNLNGGVHAILTPVKAQK